MVPCQPGVRLGKLPLAYILSPRVALPCKFCLFRQTAALKERLTRLRRSRGPLSALCVVECSLSKDCRRRHSPIVMAQEIRWYIPADQPDFVQARSLQPAERVLTSFPPDGCKHTSLAGVGRSFRPDVSLSTPSHVGAALQTLGPQTQTSHDDGCSRVDSKSTFVSLMSCYG